MLKGHLPRVIYHQVYWYTKIKTLQELVNSRCIAETFQDCARGKKGVEPKPYTENLTETEKMEKTAESESFGQDKATRQ